MVSGDWSQLNLYCVKPNIVVGNLAMLIHMLLAQVNPHALWYSGFDKPTLTVAQENDKPTCPWFKRMISPHWTVAQENDKPTWTVVQENDKPTVDRGSALFFVYNLLVSPHWSWLKKKNVNV